MFRDGATSSLSVVSTWLVALLSFLVVTSVPAFATESAPRAFAIPAGDAADTLKQFAAQALCEIMFPAVPVAGVKTNPVNGLLTPRAALDQMIASTGLVIVEDPKTGALMVTRPATTVARIGKTSPESPSPPEPPPPPVKRKNPLALIGSFIALAIAPAHPASGAESSAASPQSSASITGRVQNIATGQFLNNARVSVRGTDLVAFTDPTGTYRLLQVPAGSVVVEVFYTGLDAQSATLAATPGQSLTRDFDLTSASRYGEGSVVKLDAFTVSTARETDARAIAINEQRFAPNIKNVVSTDEFGMVTEGNVGEFIRFVPGINVDYDAADPRSITIRGLPDFLSPVTIDGNRVGSFASGSVSRKTEMEQISTNSLSRVEVVKVPTPDMAATAIGGAVNLVSRSALERSRPQFSYRAALSGNTAQLTLGKREGPSREPSRRIMPNFDFNYVHPVSRNFGYTINGLYSEQMVIQYNVAPGWAPNNETEAGIAPDNPYLRTLDLQNSVKVTVRRAASTRFDWRMAESHLFSFDIEYNTYSTNFDGNNLIFDTGTMTPTAATRGQWSSTFTQGRVGQGLVRFSGNRRHKFGNTVMPAFTYRFEGRNWKVDAAASYSRSLGYYRDLPEGYNNNINVRLLNQTVRYDEINVQGNTMHVIPTSTADYRKLSNYLLLSANQSLSDGSDVIRGARANVTYKPEHLPLTLKVGALVDQQIRDIREEARSRTYVGADGIASNADNTAAPFVRPGKSAEPSPFGFGYLEWPSVYLTADRYYAHPEQFQTNQVTALQDDANASKYIQETVTAGYVRGDSKLLGNRLWLVYGVRFERTADYGEGRLVDNNAIYQRDAAGRFVLTPAGAKIPTTTDPVAQARLINQDRAAHVTKSYSGYYPSLNASFNFTENLIGRVGAARSLGRPEFSNIAPGVVVTNPGESSANPRGLLTLNNTALEPWTATSYDLSVEYYIRPNGVLSAGFFRKDFDKFANQRVFVPTDAELAAFGFDPATYSGYTIATRFNGGAARLNGFDVNYSQLLTFLPSWAKGVSVFANATVLDIDGNNEADFSKFAPKIFNWGLRYNTHKVAVNLRWNYRALQRQSLLTSSNIAPGSTEYQRPRLQCDADVAYTFRPWLSLFAAARNLNNGRLVTQRYAPLTPSYARDQSYRDFGILLTLGVKGQF